MSPLPLSVTAVLVVAGVALQIWSTGEDRAGRQYALQLPVVLLYSLAGALFLFTAFPDSLSEGSALGFSLGGAAGFTAFFLLASFAWLARTRSRDALAARLKKAERENTRLRRQVRIERPAEGVPRPPTRSARLEIPLRGERRHRLGVITGDLANVLGVDVWVNSENTRMEMSRVSERTVSATIRYYGGERDAAGHLVRDLVAAELAVRSQGAQLAPGQVLVTGPGGLEASNDVRRIVHVAAVEGEPGSGFRQVRDLGRCVRNILGEVDRLNAGGESLRSVVLPLLGTGDGNSDLARTAEALVTAAAGYLRARPASRIRTVYLLAYTDEQAALCRAALEAESGGPDHSGADGTAPRALS